MRRIGTVLLVIGWLLGAVTTASAERNWEFSFGTFGGKAFHGDTTYRLNWAMTPAGFEPVNYKATGLRFEDSWTFGAKLTAWHLPRKYRWQPQIGFEIDGTRFTADVSPQTLSGQGVGLISGISLGDVTFSNRRELGVDSLAVNLLFRYPIWATTDRPHGLWYPYVGIGGGVQRARLSTLGYEESSVSPCFQGLVGIKLFLIKYVAVFGEAKWTQGWHSFDYASVGAPSGYSEKYAIATAHLVGGVALHF